MQSSLRKIQFVLKSSVRFRQTGRVVFDTRASSTSTSSTSAAASNDEAFEDFLENIATVPAGEKRTFANMLRHSKFMQLGDFNGRLVVGKIVQRVHDDLYIDFGLKFNAVCKAPAVNSEAYRSGARVLLRLHDPELSERFLGSKRDLTLLEADATLIRLVGNAPGAPASRRDRTQPKSRQADKDETSPAGTPSQTVAA